MIQSCSKAQSLVKKMKKRDSSAGFGLLMGCSASEVVDGYAKLEQQEKLRHQRCRVLDVPKGCLAVYVGENKQRYIIRANLLNHPVFRALLEKSANEFGFRQTGGIKFVCDPSQFEHFLCLAQKGHSSSYTLKLSTEKELVS